MKYVITVKSQLTALRPIIVIFTALLVSNAYVISKRRIDLSDADERLVIVLITISCYFLIFFIPALYLHLEYYHFNKRTILQIEPDENKLIYVNKSGVRQVFYFNELSNIVYYMERRWTTRPYSLTFSPYRYYHFARITTIKGEEIFITSLMAPVVEDALNVITGVPIEKKIWFFNSIRISRWLMKKR